MGNSWELFDLVHFNDNFKGKPKPNQRVLSWYDDKDYSKKKLISLVEQVRLINFVLLKILSQFDISFVGKVVNLEAPKH